MPGFRHAFGWRQTLPERAPKLAFHAARVVKLEKDKQEKP